MTDFPILTILVFLPLAGSLFLFPFWKNEGIAKVTALIVAVAELALAGWIYLAGPAALSASDKLPGFFLTEDSAWIKRFGIRYTLGMDGISLLLVLLTAFTMVVAIVAAWRWVKERGTLHYFLILAMESGIMGVFLSLDLFLFYLFWEVMLIPMFFLIGIWGDGRCIYSTVKFFLYTLAGSLLMLVAIIGLYLIHGSQTGIYTFALAGLLHTALSPATGFWLFAAFLLAFAIKIPLFPFHTWLPDAYSDSSITGTLIMAALMAKTGAYGLIRFAYPLFPEAAARFTPFILALAVIGILYGSWIAYAQQDMKRLIAYSSFGHMGFIALGIAAWTPVALSGAVLQMVNHGITTGALFVVIGMLGERAATREAKSFGGLWGRVPVFAFFFLLFSMASAGLPGLNNFTGEFMILIGSFKVAKLPVILAYLGIILPLIYTVRLVQDILFGEEKRVRLEGKDDLSLREGALVTVMALFVVYLGVHPGPVLELVRTPVAFLTGIR
ncbi:MAG TPA: NADH-quinone oxidoreductase subunit M [Geobacteraceae bacterium]|nr:NADH-quinone oxidoreductase subunit M [Geobacteraceae bacterium]